MNLTKWFSEPNKCLQNPSQMKFNAWYDLEIKTNFLVLHKGSLVKQLLTKDMSRKLKLSLLCMKRTKLKGVTNYSVA